jgi:hypothetical protein
LDAARRTALVVVAATAVGLGGVGAASATTFVASGQAGDAYVPTGQTLRVRLPAANSGSTGHHWQQRAEQNRELRRVSQRTSPDGKFQVFVYRARRAGIADLRFAYMAPGGNGRVARRFKLAAYVNDPWRATGCRPKGSRTIVQNAEARVFTLQRKVYSVLSTKRVAFTGYYGCVFGGRAFGFDGVASNDPNKWFPENRYFFPTLRGSMFGHAFFFGGTRIHFATDGYYAARTFDLRQGKLIRTAFPDQGGPGTNNPIEDLVMSESGGLAWTERAREGTLVARSDKPPKQTGGVAKDRTVIDDGQSGTVDPKSLGLDGLDVTWLRDGQLQRAPLG